MIKVVVLLLTFCCFVKFTIGQNIPPKDDQKSKAAALIEKAKNSIYKGIVPESIRSISLESASVNSRKLKNGETRSSTQESKLFVVFPDQIRIEEDTDFSTNQSVSTEILNPSKVSITSDVLVNGQPFSFGNNLGSIVPKLTKEQRIDSIKRKTFNIIFPLLLQSSWYKNLEFTYVGEAESSDFKANVVEIKDNDGNKFQLFFDQTSHLPILMVQKFINPFTKTEDEKKTYYSDYRTLNGIMIAHKIIVQTGNTATEEREVKNLELNPKFKPNLFDVKEDKVNPY